MNRKTKSAATAVAELDQGVIYLNQELETRLDRRVLAQAEDPTIPLLERLRYLEAPRVLPRVITQGLNPYLKDNMNAWELDASGRYSRKRPRGKQSPFCAQQHLAQSLGAMGTLEQVESWNSSSGVMPRRNPAVSTSRTKPGN